MARLMETQTALKLGLMPTVFAIVAALYFAQAVLIPLAVAILLTFLIAPLVTWLERWRMPVVIAVLLPVGTSLAVLGAITWVVERQVVDVAAKLPDYQENIQNKLWRFRGAAGGSFSKAAKGLEVTVKNMTDTQPSTQTSVTEKGTTALLELSSHSITPAIPQVSPQNPLPVREYLEPSPPLQIVGYCPSQNNEGGTGTPGYDFMSRFFSVGAGIDEDPVTRSAHCCLGAYWQARLGRASLRRFKYRRVGYCPRPCGTRPGFPWRTGRHGATCRVG